MKIEAGKYYKTRDGRKVGPINVPPKNTTWSSIVKSDAIVDGVWRGWCDGGCYNTGFLEHGLDLIAEWTDDCAHPFCGDTCGTPAIGTLAELDVKPGDVVECQGQVYDLVIVTPETNHPRARLCAIGDLCALSRDGKQHQSVRQSSVCHWKLISRATPAPSIDLTAITTPFGLLDKATQDALVAHGGPYQFYSNSGWIKIVGPSWATTATVRVSPGPKRETVTNREMYITPRGCIASNGLMDGARRCVITYDTIDGVIDMATYRVVAK